MTFLIVLLVLVVIVLGWAFFSYNRFVSQRQGIDNSWSNIDTELQRRHDLIPNIVNTVKGYAAHESSVFEAVTTARANVMSFTGNPEEVAKQETILSSALKSLLAVAENYPELKASENFRSLQLELTNTEDRIQATRRFFNGNVRDYNTRVESVPSAIIASMFHFTKREYFQLEDSVRAAGAPVVDI